MAIEGGQHAEESFGCDCNTMITTVWSWSVEDTFASRGIDQIGQARQRLR